MRLFAVLGGLLDRTNGMMVILSAVLLLGLTFIVGTDITLRYLFYRPLGWVKEISEYILVFLGFLVAAWILKDDGHVKMDLLLNHLSPRAQILLNIVTSVISTIIVVVVAAFSIRVTLQFYKTHTVAPTVLEPPKWILITPIIFGSFLLALQFARRTYGFLVKWKTLADQKTT